MEITVQNRATNGSPEPTTEVVETIEEVRPAKATWPLALYVTSGVLIVAAAGLVVRTIGVQSSAADTRDQVVALEQRQDEARDEAAAAEAAREETLAEVRAVELAVRNWHSASNRFRQGSEEFVAASNVAIDLGNAGDYDAALAHFHGAVSQRLGDLERRMITLQEAEAEVASAVDELAGLVSELKGDE